MASNLKGLAHITMVVNEWKNWHSQFLPVGYIYVDNFYGGQFGNSYYIYKCIYPSANQLLSGDVFYRLIFFQSGELGTRESGGGKETSFYPYPFEHVECSILLITFPQNAIFKLYVWNSYKRRHNLFSPSVKVKWRRKFNVWRKWRMASTLHNRYKNYLPGTGIHLTKLREDYKTDISLDLEWVLDFSKLSERQKHRVSCQGLCLPWKNNMGQTEGITELVRWLQERKGTQVGENTDPITWWMNATWVWASNKTEMLGKVCDREDPSEEMKEI